MSAFATVADLRAALIGLPDEAEVVIEGTHDVYGIRFAAASQLIVWSHPDRCSHTGECPTRLGLEINACTRQELAEDDEEEGEE